MVAEGFQIGPSLLVSQLFVEFICSRAAYATVGMWMVEAAASPFVGAAATHNHDGRA
jgi:hypothetical protein